jgi:dUTP pyrophosphatase
MAESKISFQRIHPDAYLPSYGTDGAVGMDVACIEDIFIHKRDRALVSTGLKLTGIPGGCYLRIAPRSGLAAKQCIDVEGGVVDPDYQGEIKVILMNNSDSPKRFNKGDRIAQFIVEKCERPQITEYASSTVETQRGAGGFGSTGLTSSQR